MYHGFNFPYLSCAVFALVIINLIYTAPVEKPESLFQKFAQEMHTKNCNMPDQIVFPFNVTEIRKEKGGSPLIICENIQETERSKEAEVLCTELFNIWRSISCREPIESNNFPQINITLSHQVCEDLNSMKNEIPKEKELLTVLTNSLSCGIMCDGEFQKACQVLLWSFKVEKQMEGYQKGQVAAKELNAADNSHKLTVEAPSTNTLNVTNTKSNPRLSQDIEIAEKGETLSTLSDPNANNLGESAKGKITKLEEEQNQMDVKPTLMDINEPISTIAAKKTVKVVQNELTIDEGVDHETGLNNAALKESNKNTESIIEKSKISIEEITKSETEILKKSPTAKPSDSSPSKLSTLLNNAHNPIDSIKKELGKSSIAENTVENKISSTKEIKDDTANTVPETKGSKTTSTLEGKQTAEKTSSFDSSSLPSGISELSSLAPMDEVSTFRLEKMEGGQDIQTNNKDTDQYTDLENTEADADDGEEYPKPSFDEKPDEMPKSLEPVAVPSDATSKNVFILNPPKETFNEFPSIEKFGRGSEDIQVIAAFPEQEDSHFFFYFLSMVLILMGGYLLFHNKQKIIALIVEGRHERRRRSNGAGYKKLDTK